MISRTAGIVVFAALTFAARALAWDYEGHRVVTQLAVASLPPDFPAFVRTAEARERLAFLSGEPDRWRNVPNDLPIKHANAPEHFIDFEDLEPARISPDDLIEFRQVFAAQLAEARAKNPDRFPAIDPEKNKDRTRELVGFLPWTIAEQFGKLKACFSYLKVYEELGTAAEISNAPANVIYVMGVLSHYVGDGAQPLHTTKHFNGWVGENPKKYTTSKGFHAWIDGGFFKKMGGLDAAALEQKVKPAKPLGRRPDTKGRDPVFVDVLDYLREQFTKVEPLYAIDKAGKLTVANASAAEGKTFLEEQLALGGTMLGSLWLTAWKDAPPDTYLRAALIDRQAQGGGKK